MKPKGEKVKAWLERNPRERGEKAQLEGARASGQMERTEGQRTDSPEGDSLNTKEACRNPFI